MLPDLLYEPVLASLAFFSVPSVQMTFTCICANLGSHVACTLEAWFAAEEMFAEG